MTSLMSHSPDPEDLEDALFVSKLDSVGSLATVLKSVAFGEKVNLFISDNGLKFTVEETKSIQAYILVQKSLFLEYNLRSPEEIFFKIPLKELLDCLKIFCSDGKGGDVTSIDHFSNTCLSLTYQRPGAPFQFTLEEYGMQSSFQLKPEEIDDLMDIDIEPISCKIAMKSDMFFELLAEVENNEPEIIEFEVNPTQQFVKISATGITGLMEVLIPATSAVVEYFDCRNLTDICKAKYRMSSFKHTFKAAQVGEKLVLKMNDKGMLSLSFLLTTKADSFVEFVMLCVDGEEE